jgi:hypothetical protein
VPHTKKAGKCARGTHDRKTVFSVRSSQADAQGHHTQQVECNNQVALKIENGFESKQGHVKPGGECRSQ